jgi:hypothetical protein
MDEYVSLIKWARLNFVFHFHWEKKVIILLDAAVGDFLLSDRLVLKN